MPIKIETIKNISRFVRVLTPKVRLKFLPVFKNLGSNKEPWRVRALIAKQLEEIVYLYPNDIVGKNLANPTSLLESIKFFKNKNVKT